MSEASLQIRRHSQVLECSAGKIKGNGTAIGEREMVVKIDQDQD